MQNEVNNSKDLNKMLTKMLTDLRSGELHHDTAKTMTLIADKINKNNCNDLQYKKITKHKNKLDFFE